MFVISIINHEELLSNKKIMNEEIIPNHVLSLLNELNVELNSKSNNFYLIFNSKNLLLIDKDQ
jgi:hypothetical protein